MLILQHEEILHSVYAIWTTGVAVKSRQMFAHQQVTAEITRKQKDH
jgi:hypothetical protein